MIILKLKNVNFTIPNTESTKYRIIRANKVSFCKKGSKLFNGYKMIRKLSHYGKCFQKSADILSVLMKVNTCHLLKKYNKIWDKG